MIAAYEPDHQVVFLDDEFEPTTSDVDWMTDLANREENWSVISGDGRILRNPAERAVLRDTELNFFVLAKKWWAGKFHDRAVQLLKVWPAIVDAAERVRKPTIWRVPKASTKLDRISFTADL